MPVTLRLVLAALLLLTGLALVTVAALGARARLPRNRFAGVRTRASLHSGPAFVAANRVAAPLLGAAGAIALVGGAALAAADRAGPGLGVRRRLGARVGAAVRCRWCAG